MKATIVRLSRPLLLRVYENYEEEYYWTVYGFAIRRELTEKNLENINVYVNYLAGLHAISNGFKVISTDPNSWTDIQGKSYPYTDDRVKELGREYRECFEVGYSLIPLDVDEEDYHSMVNEEDIIVDEKCYYDLEEELENYRNADNSYELNE